MNFFTKHLSFFFCYHKHIIHILQRYSNVPLNTLVSISITITDSNGLNVKAWCMPTYTSKSSLLPCIVQTSVLTHMYCIDTTADISNSSTANLHIAYMITNKHRIHPILLNQHTITMLAFDSWLKGYCAYCLRSHLWHQTSIRSTFLVGFSAWSSLQCF